MYAEKLTDIMSREFEGERSLQQSCTSLLNMTYTRSTILQIYDPTEAVYTTLKAPL